jgi:hypothetical protein
MGWNTESAQVNYCGARSWTLSENSHGRKSNKGWEWGWGNKPTTRSRVVVDHCASLMGLRVVLKTSLPHLTGGGADQPELQLWGNTAAAWWNNISSDHFARTGSYLRSQLHAALWTEEPIIAHKPVTWWDHLQWTPQKTRKRGGTPAVSTPSCLTKGEAPFPTKHRISSTNIRIGCQRIKSRNLTEQTGLFVGGFFFLYYLFGFFSVLLTSPSLFSSPYSFKCGSLLMNVFPIALGSQ